MTSVAGKTALVTGGSRGIGLRIARGLVEAGARVYVSSRKASDVELAALDDLAKTLETLPAGATPEEIQNQVFEVGTATMMAAKDVIKPLYEVMQQSGLPFDPGAFLPAAERYGLMARIDQWVVNNTLAWMGDRLRQQGIPCLVCEHPAAGGEDQE